MPLANDHNVIKAFPPDRTDQVFTVSILPRRTSGGRLVANAHRAERSFENVAIGGIAVADEISWRLFPTTGFSELA